ncbi:hypothetical protein BC941DRAFT_207042 [Chlamydoabsidia padenii]|nr:hypothetical protein BC941DRAFT_207042 [Chlamydoabsidia padenii]
MRFSSYFVILGCFMLTLVLAKPSLQDRLTTVKSSSPGQKYALLKPVSAAISYLYYTTQPPNFNQDANRNVDINTSSNEGTRMDEKQQGNGYRTKNILVDNSSSNTIDVNRHNGPVTALVLVLFFCVLTF